MRSVKIVLLLCLSMLCCAVGAQGASTPTGPSVQLSWTPPVLRENGNALSVADIGGYELKYRVKGANGFTTLVIQGGATNSYVLNGLSGADYEFFLSAFDTNDLYGVAASITYKLITSVPKTVTNFNAKRTSFDVVEACGASSACKVVKGDGQ